MSTVSSDILDERANAAEAEAQGDPQDVLSAEEIAYANYVPRPPDEAGISEYSGVAFCTLVGPRGGKVNITARKLSCKAALTELMEAVKYAGETYGLVPETYKQAEKAPQFPQVSSPAPVTSSTPQPVTTAVAPAPTSAAPIQPQPELQYFIAVRMKITPVEGGKTKLEFFGNDRKQPVNDFPTLVATSTNDRVIEVLKSTGAWELSHLQVVKTFETYYKVYWKEGKIRPDGKSHYKDLVKIEPAEIPY